MKHVQIMITGKDSYLRDTTIGKVYTARRYDVGDTTEFWGVVQPHEAPRYYFEDDVGDTVDTLPLISGVFIKEVDND